MTSKPLLAKCALGDGRRYFGRRHGKPTDRSVRNVLSPSQRLLPVPRLTESSQRRPWRNPIKRRNGSVPAIVKVEASLGILIIYDSTNPTRAGDVTAPSASLKTLTEQVRHLASLKH
ncbi:hypothetical protein J6590_034588 [Homalodisca vitripennis]|nr:hypothetical protein J6590_034588 [Homalodisca vitripennis]